MIQNIGKVPILRETAREQWFRYLKTSLPAKGSVVHNSLSEFDESWEIPTVDQWWRIISGLVNRFLIFSQSVDNWEFWTFSSHANICRDGQRTDLFKEFTEESVVGKISGGPIWEEIEWGWLRKDGKKLHYWWVAALIFHMHSIPHSRNNKRWMG